MTQPRRPAAYLCAAPGSPPGTLAGERRAVAEAARQRGWLQPAIYADAGHGRDGRPGPALVELEAAVSAGRHDAVLLASPAVISGSSPVLLMRLLHRCTQGGVTVELLPNPAPRGPRPGPGHDAQERRTCRPTSGRRALQVGQRGPRPGTSGQ